MIEHPLLRTVPTPAGMPACHGAMLAIWHLRPATQRRFPLHRRRTRDWLRFLAWCATDGRKDYALLREIPAWDRELRRPASLPALAADRWRDTHSLASFLHGVTLHRWTLSGMLRSPAARDFAARRFWSGARHRHHAPSVPTWQQQALLQLHGSASALAKAVRPGSDRHLDPRKLVGVYGLQDLAAADRSRQVENPPAFPIPPGLQRSPVPLPHFLARALEPMVQLMRAAPTHPESVAITRLIETGTPPPRIKSGTFGVNLIGFARGELGIGEDIRQVALALEAAGVPVCIIDFAPGKNISQANTTADRLMSGQPLYGINLFCLTGIETTRYVCERGLATGDGRYNIGLWPWELPDWPDNCRHAYACVDEIWGISKYTANAHRFAEPRPVLAMGLPVDLGPVADRTRRDFGLPTDAYLYCFAFDINSSAARKNPEGLITAFQKAFPRASRDKVGLVLKISHPETGCKLWRRIRRAARRDPRIHLVEQTMRRPELLALFKACDCFVSLHRAEGFGRCLAEALLLGKQVVTTGFSGNLDFCREPRVALVRHRMVALEVGDYMWGTGQSWADPDLDHAAELMRSVRNQPRPVTSDDFPFHPATVSTRYAARLHEIWSHHAPIQARAVAL